MTPHPRLPVAVLSLLALAAALRAQQPSFKTSVDLVRVNVAVTDRGQPVKGLTAADFELLDNGVAQTIEATYGEQQPLDVSLVFDTSYSIAGRTLARLKEAAHAVVDGLRPRDTASLLTFSHRLRLALPPSGDIVRLRKAIDETKAEGATSLLDALYTAILQHDATDSRAMALVFSDGLDNRSWLSDTSVLQVAKETDVVVYAVAFRPASGDSPFSAVRHEPDERLLRSLSEATGGMLVMERDNARLKDLFVRLLNDMRSRYLLTYYPRGVARPGWHTLAVRLKHRSGRVQARPGYNVR